MAFLPEAAVQELELPAHDAHVVVLVHRLRHARDGHGEVAPPDLLVDLYQPAHRAIAADGARTPG
jgi:hypothetical protein